MTPTIDSNIQRIDVEGVLRKRAPRFHRLLPRFVINWVKRVICQDELNILLENNYRRKGADFCAGILADLDVSYRLCSPELMPDADDRRVVFVCNHPLGALDGVAIIDMLAKRYGRTLHFVVNDLLMAIEPLHEVFIPINKHGAQSRQASLRVDDAFNGPDPVIVFPAGLVSRRDAKGRIADLKWHKMFVNKCISSGRDVIPLYFDGRNSSKFYRLAHWRTRLGIKMNYEMVLLPGEIFRCRGVKFDIKVGRRIPVASLQGGRLAQANADKVRHAVYDLSHIAV